jgi:hypothetical protein
MDDYYLTACYEGIRVLRNLGYAIAIFTPSEIGDHNRQYVENHMVDAGTAYLDIDSEG